MKCRGLHYWNYTVAGNKLVLVDVEAHAPSSVVACGNMWYFYSFTYCVLSDVLVIAALQKDANYVIKAVEART